MWSSTNQRIKALISAKNRERERLTRPIHVRRADLVLSFRSDDGFLIEVPARALLNDLTPDGFCAYAVTGLTPNVELTIQFEHPKPFRLTAKVVWCQYQPSSSHVLTTQTYPYRVGLALLWKDATIEAEFKKFCEKLGDLYVNKKGLFIEEEFTTPPVTAETPVAAAAVTGDPLAIDVPAPKESDEGAAPSDEQVAAEMAAAKAAEVAAEALKAANPPAGTVPDAGASTESTASVLDALKDFDPAKAA